MKLDEILTRFGDGLLSEDEALESLVELGAAGPTRALSEGQRGLWVLQKLAPESDVYNVPLSVRVEGALEREAVEGAWRHVCEQVPLLGSRIVEEEGEPRFERREGSAGAVRVEAADGWSEARVRRRLRELAKVPMELERGPLARMHWLRGAQCGEVLLIVVHHVVFDGASVPVLMNGWVSALEALSQGREPPALKQSASFEEFVQWEREYLEGEGGQRDRAYWLEQLKGPLPVLELVSDRPRRGGEVARGGTCWGTVTGERSARVRELCAAQGLSAAALF